MGREIRSVPPNWDHPRASDGYLQPMFKERYEQAVAKWIANHLLWSAGVHQDQLTESEGNTYKASDHEYYAQWNGGPPDINYYNTYYTKDQATWFQLYETVTEGTPVSPPFATREELIDYLKTKGENWS